ncbi:hypothetical protein SAMN03159496_03536 [Rhizobium sp. NFR07]|nr:hypothetical protein SAMN03159496_03536 [Rhizobium sp. NFR07]
MAAHKENLAEGMTARFQVWRSKFIVIVAAQGTDTAFVIFHDPAVWLQPCQL